LHTLPCRTQAKTGDGTLPDPMLKKLASMKGMEKMTELEEAKLMLELSGKPQVVAQGGRPAHGCSFSLVAGAG